MHVLSDSFVVKQGGESLGRKQPMLPDASNSIHYNCLKRGLWFNGAPSTALEGTWEHQAAPESPWELQAAQGSPREHQGAPGSL